MAKTRSMTRNQNYDDDNASSSSTKRFKTFDNDGVAHWSDLNHDVLFIIMMQLGVVDFLAFSGVCKSWRSFALTNKNMFMASMPPMSMWISTNDDEKDSYLYLDDFKGRRFKTILPHSSGRTFFGVTCGYLILFNRKTHDFLLVNPITRHELHFPDYPLDIGVDEEGIKAILVFSPTISRWVFVLLHGKISFYILGKRRWNHVSSTLPTPCILDLHAFKGKIYTLHVDCSLRELKLDRKWNHKWTLVETNNSPNQDLFVPELVNTTENLYMIHRYCIPKKVLELDFGEMKWVSPKIKGEFALFVSKVKAFAAIKPEVWAEARMQYTSRDYFIGEDKSRKCKFYFEWMWYFPHDCLSANFLVE